MSISNMVAGEGRVSSVGEVPLFSGSSGYALWEYKFQVYVGSLAGGEAAMTTPRPVEPFIPEPAAVRKAREERLRDWDLGSGKMAHALLVAVREHKAAEEALVLMWTMRLQAGMPKATGAEQLTFLREKYHQTDHQELTAATVKLYSLKIGSSRSSEDYAVLFESLHAEVVRLGGVMNEAAKLGLLRNSLKGSTKYAALATNLLTTPNLTYDHALAIVKSFTREVEGPTEDEQIGGKRGRELNLIAAKPAKRQKAEWKKRCFNCGSEDHLKSECPKPLAERKGKGAARDGAGVTRKVCNYCKKPSHVEAECWKKRADLENGARSGGATKGKDPRFQYNGGRGKEVSMVMEPGERDSLDTDDEKMFIDTCASGKMLLVSDKKWLFNFSEAWDVIGTADSVATGLQVEGRGTIDDVEVLFVPSLRKNVMALKNLVDRGMELRAGKHASIFHEESKELVCEVHYQQGCMPYIRMDQLPAVLRFNRGDDVVMLIDGAPKKGLSGTDILEYWHKRYAHRPKSLLVEAYKRRSMIGMNLPRSVLSKKCEMHSGKCGVCEESRPKRHWNPTEQDLTALAAGDVIYMDVSVYLNCESTEGYKYVLNIIDSATKYFWSFPMKTKTEASTLEAVTSWFAIDIGQIDLKVRRIHTDGGGEFTGARIREFITQTVKAEHTWSPPDTPEMNGLVEELNGELGRMTLANLLNVGRPPAMWWKAYAAAREVALRLPTTTVFGFMTPFEALTGQIPSVNHFRVWGCRAWVKTKIGRKQFDEKAVEGIFVGYSRQPIGWEINIPSLGKNVTSIFVSFEENEPPGTEQTNRHTAAQVPIVQGERTLKEYDYLIGKQHIDDEDGLLYQVTRIGERRGVIVAWRGLVTASGKITESRVPIHIYDIELLTKATASARAAGAEEVLALLAHKGSGGDEAGLDGKGDPSPGVSGGWPPGAIGVQRIQDDPRGPGYRAQLREREVMERQLRGQPSKSKGSKRSGSMGLLRELLYAVQMNEISAAIAPTMEIIAPKSYKKAMASMHSKEWSASMSKEIEGIMSNDTLEGPVDLPPGMKALRPWWIYRVKKGIPPTEPAFILKSRLTIDGSEQREGVDFWESFAATAKGVTFRVLMIISLLLRMSVHHLDVSNAFLYAALVEEIYMSDWEGGTLPRGKVWKLKKSLYGLKQAPRNWSGHFKKSILALGFLQSQCDPCAYFHFANNCFTWLLVYVDDILISSQSEAFREEVVGVLKSVYKLKELGEVSRYVGITVERPKLGVLVLHQRDYIVEKLVKYNIYVKVFASPRKTPLPLDVATRLLDTATPESADQEWVDHFPYLEIIGSLLYLSVHTRPDMAHGVGMMARYSQKRSFNACYCVCYLLSYLSGTVNLGVTYRRTRFGLDFHGFSDADWAGDLEHRRSTFGYVIFFALGPVSWMSKLIKSICTSSMESEYTAEFKALQEIVWLRALLEEMKLEEPGRTPLFMDASCAIALSGDPVHHSQAKHIEIKMHWNRVATDSETGFARLEKIISERMVADPMTKQLGVHNTLGHRPNLMGITKLAFEEEKIANVEFTENKRRRIAREKLEKKNDER